MEKYNKSILRNMILEKRSNLQTTNSSFLDNMTPDPAVEKARAANLGCTNLSQQRVRQDSERCTNASQVGSELYAH